jgi:hypothetical protein
MAKVVQTSLEEEEYRVFKEMLVKRKLSIREGLRTAVTKMVEEEVRIDPRDRFLARTPRGKSGLGNLSREHDKYLYGKKRAAAGNLLDYVRSFSPDEELASAFEKVLEKRRTIRLRSPRF